MSLRGRMSLLGATAVLVAACSSGGGATPAPSEAASAAPSEAAPSAAESTAPSESASAAPIAGGLLDKVLKAGKIVMSTDPNTPPQSSLEDRRHVRGLRHRRRHRDRQAPRRRDRSSRPPDWDAHHRRRLGRPLGLQRRVDDDHVEAPEGARLQRPVLLHPGPDGRKHRVGHHDPRRARRQDGLRRRGDDVPRLAQGRSSTSGRVSPTTTPPAGVKATTLTTDRQCAETWKAGRNGLRGLAELLARPSSRRSRTGCRS